MRFKPYYKWITFNTLYALFPLDVLHLGFKPYYKWITFNTEKEKLMRKAIEYYKCFKPYYKWITFNTQNKTRLSDIDIVLNLIINGLPSIPATW